MIDSPLFCSSPPPPPLSAPAMSATELRQAYIKAAEEMEKRKKAAEGGWVLSTD